MNKRIAFIFGIVVLTLSIIGCPTEGTTASFPKLKLQDINAGTGITSLDVNGADTVDLEATHGAAALKLFITLSKNTKATGIADFITINSLVFDGTKDPTLKLNFDATDFAAGDTVTFTIFQGLLALVSNPSVTNPSQTINVIVQ